MLQEAIATFGGGGAPTGSPSATAPTTAPAPPPPPRAATPGADDDARGRPRPVERDVAIAATAGVLLVGAGLLVGVLLVGRRGRAPPRRPGCAAPALATPGPSQPANTAATTENATSVTTVASESVSAT